MIGLRPNSRAWHVSAGALFYKRFNTPVQSFIVGVGGEVGVEVRVYRTLHFGLGLGFTSYRMEGLGYETLCFHLAMGL